jgi:hypothetical protein
MPDQRLPQCVDLAHACQVEVERHPERFHRGLPGHLKAAVKQLDACMVLLRLGPIARTADGDE